MNKILISSIYLDKIKHNHPKTQIEIQIEPNGKEVLK